MSKPASTTPQSLALQEARFSARGKIRDGSGEVARGLEPMVDARPSRLLALLKGSSEAPIMST